MLAQLHTMVVPTDGSGAHLILIQSEQYNIICIILDVGDWFLMPSQPWWLYQGEAHFFRTRYTLKEILCRRFVDLLRCGVLWK